jgi:hypothetical protein
MNAVAEKLHQGDIETMHTWVALNDETFGHKEQVGGIIEKPEGSEIVNTTWVNEIVIKPRDQQLPANDTLIWENDQILELPTAAQEVVANLQTLLWIRTDDLKLASIAFELTKSATRRRAMQEIK